MELVIVRHGKAEDLAASDEVRPLTDEGRETVTKIFRNLQAYLPEPDLICDSGLLRAQQTADLIAEVYDLPPRKELGELRPGASPMDLAKVLQKLPVGDVIFVVGHQPELSRLVAHSLAGGEYRLIDLKKAGVVWISFLGSYQPGSGRLQCYLPPAVAKRASFKD
jgi:phosphohistidine phosphatase